jgi:hypothetical protein
MIYTTVAENGAEEKHSVGCDDLADALDLAAMVYPDATLFGHSPIDITVGGEVVAQIVENGLQPDIEGEVQSWSNLDEEEGGIDAN